MLRREADEAAHINSSHPKTIPFMLKYKQLCNQILCKLNQWRLPYKHRKHHSNLRLTTNQHRHRYKYVSTAPLSTRLSEISTPEGSESDLFKKTLAGRTFTVNASFDEYVSFTSESKYLFSYYEKPVEGRPKLQASSKPGTYTVNNKTISLDNGETFEIVGDYLVKNTEKVSKNRTAVYFDALQLNSVIPNVSLALNNYLKSNKKPQDADFEKTRIDRFFCHADRSFKKMTNADSYICDTTYSYVFDQSKIQPQITTAKVKDFPTYCLTKGNSYSSYVSDGGNCNSDYSISNWSYVIVRTDNVTYRVTGAFRAVSDSTETLPRF